MKTLVESVNEAKEGSLKKVKETEDFGRDYLTYMDQYPPKKDTTFLYINREFGYFGFSSDEGIRDTAEELEDDSILKILDLKVGQMGTVDDENYYVRIK